MTSHQNTQNVWKDYHNYSNLAQSQMLLYKHEQCMVHVPDNCTKYEPNHHILLWDITTNAQNLWKKAHNYSNLAQSQIRFYMHQRTIVPGQSIEYEENPASHYGGIHKDRLTDGLTARWTGPFPILGRAGNNKIGKWQGGVSSIGGTVIQELYVGLTLVTIACMDH